MHKHLFIFVYSTQKPVSNYNKNAAPITVLVIMLTSNVIKFYMLMSLLGVFKDKENKIGKITYTKFKKIYSTYRGDLKKLYKLATNIHV